MLIRVIDTSDLALFQAIRLEALRTDPSQFASSEEKWQSLSDAQWTDIMDSTIIVCAFREEEPIAVMGVRPQEAEKMAHRGDVVMVYVRPADRGTGLAGQMVDALVAASKEEGLVQLELAVSTENAPALAFYKRHGFARIGVIPGGFRIGDREIDEVLMARRIDV